MLAHPPGELAPPDRGNPGSATGLPVEIEKPWGQGAVSTLFLLLPVEVAPVETEACEINRG